VQLLQKLDHEVCVGDAAQIRASYLQKQKTDRRNAKHIPQLLVEGRFPRIWIPDAEMRDHRQLLMHRHKLVQIRTRVKNELQHFMLNQEMQKKQKLWSTEDWAALARLPLQPWTDRRRKDLLNLLAMLDAQLESLNDATMRVAKEYPGVQSQVTGDLLATWKAMHISQGQHKGKCCDCTYSWLTHQQM
jgi:transposase